MKGYPVHFLGENDLPADYKGRLRYGDSTERQIVIDEIIERFSAKTIEGFLEIIQKEYGNRIALREMIVEQQDADPVHGEILSYKQFVDRTVHISEELKAMGIGKGTRVGLISENHIPALIFKYACMRIGAVVVPWTENTEAAGMTIKEAMSRAEVTWVSTRGAMPYTIGSGGVIEQGEQINPHDLAMLMYSSGTGGKAPKLIGISHANLLYHYFTAPGFLRQPIGARCLHILPPYHIFGETVAGAALSAGSEITLSDIPSLGRNGKALLQNRRFQFMSAVPDVYTRVRQKMEDGLHMHPMGQNILSYLSNDITAHVRADIARVEAMGNPALLDATQKYWASLEKKEVSPLPTVSWWRRLFKHFLYRRVLKKAGLDALEFGISGGSALPAGTRAFFHALGVPYGRIISGWGMTETSGIGTIPNPDGSDPAATVGELPPGTVAWAEENDVGLPEIHIIGPGIARYMDEETQRELIPDGVLKTGDIGAVYENIVNSRGDIVTLLSLSGRVKRIIKWKGESVLPEPIEMLLQENSHIAEALLVGDEGERLGVLLSLRDVNIIDDLNSARVRNLLMPHIRECTSRRRTKQRADIEYFWVIDKFPDQFRTLSRKLKPPLIEEYLRDKIEQMWREGKIEKRDIC